MAGDKGYSNSRVRDWLRKYGIKPLIPRKENEKLRNDGRSVFDKQAHRRRSIVEQTIGSLKECRRSGTRFEKLAINVLAMMKLAMIQRCRKMAFSDRAWCQPLEHLLRYCARPPFSLERLSVRRGEDGRIARVRYVLPRHKAANRVEPGARAEVHPAGGQWRRFRRRPTSCP